MIENVANLFDSQKLNQKVKEILSIDSKINRYYRALKYSHLKFQKH